MSRLYWIRIGNARAFPIPGLMLSVFFRRCSLPRRVDPSIEDCLEVMLKWLTTGKPVIDILEDL